MDGQGGEAAGADQQMAKRPGIGEWDHAECHLGLIAPRIDVWNDGEADAAAGHGADVLETVEPHANLELPALAGGMGRKERKMLEIPVADREVPKVSF